MFPSYNNIVAMLSVPYNKQYFTNMSKLDLQARNSTSDYFKEYIMQIKEFTDEEKSKLDLLVRKADTKLKSYTNISSIPWKIAKLCCNTENGFPHTIGDTIFLPENYLETSSHAYQLETLIHEKIHIYQRTFPIYTNLLITKFWKYSIVQTRDKIENARANPDLNNIVYTRNPLSKSYCYSMYTSNPKSLSDSFLTPQCREQKDIYEHPFEQMAYMIANIVTADTIEKTDDYINLLYWVKNYL
jgi:hypothetical protein